MIYVRLILIPFSLIYGLVVIIRNWCYDAGLLKTRKFDLPVISVGNLEVGGAGKSPMTEYLVNLLKDNFKLATLSRGYGRKTKGFLIADSTSTAGDIGDEPAQFKQKFPAVTVAVCEDRVAGIEKLKAAHKLIILDDAYQHRAVKPGLSILLFDYASIKQPHLLLPAGNMREPFSSRWRADVLIVSKCPERLTEQEKLNITEKIQPLPYQPLLFTSIQYLPLQNLEGQVSNVIVDSATTVFLLTGIANHQPLYWHLKNKGATIVSHNYPDHHRFSLKNITKLADEYAACKAQKKLIITTEKDAQRLIENQLLPLVNMLPILVLPIGVQFLNNKEQFDKIIIENVREYTANNGLH